MEILFRILMGVEAVICVLLIGIVLIQRSKGQGAGLSFGGGAEAIFGAQMGNVLTRTTVVLGVLFVLNTTVLAIIRPTRSTRSIAERFTPATPPAAPATTPAAPIAGDAIPLPEPLDIAAEAAEPAPMPMPMPAVETEATAEADKAVEAVEADAAPVEATDKAVETVEADAAPAADANK